jgi:hypothetical protein
MRTLQRSLRITEDLLDKLHRKLKTEGKQMNPTLVSWIRRYTDSDEETDPITLALEDKKREVRRPGLEQQAETLAATVADLLHRNPEWARQAILKADLGPPGSWAFGERIGHFIDEKDHLATQFGPWLIRRILYLTSHSVREASPSGESAANGENATGKTKLILVLDSGTTMGSFFRTFVSLLARSPAVSGVVVVTNNISAVECFLNACRTEKNSDASIPSLEDRVTCILLPGKALPEYGAVTGVLTTELLDRIRGENATAICIGLTTGNWVHLSESPPFWPVPMVRGAGHGDFKEALIRNSDEVYLLSPLGKVFANVSTISVNNAWNFRRDDPNPRRRTYEEVHIAPLKSSAIRVVSTFRSPEQVLYRHSALIGALLKAADQASWEQSAEKPFSDVPNVLLPFAKFSSERRERQIEIEVPHDYARTDAFMSEFLLIQHAA